MSVDEYDTQFVHLSRYASHMIPNEEEKICRFVLGLCLRLRQFVSMQMELYPSYMATVDAERTTEMNEKDEDEELKRKRKCGNKGRSSGYSGPSGASKPPGRGNRLPWYLPFQPYPLVVSLDLDQTSRAVILRLTKHHNKGVISLSVQMRTTPFWFMFRGLSWLLPVWQGGPHKKRLS